MSFRIIRNNIINVEADAIVNTANPMPVVGRGTDSAVYMAAGRDELISARKKIGVIERGQAAWTDSFNLKKNGIKYIIHTVGVFYNEDKNGETEILRNCYRNSLNLAKELGCRSIAIPLLATGFYAFPKELGLQIAVDEISKFLIKNEFEVILVVYDKKSYLISEKLFDDIKSFIDENCTKEEHFERDFRRRRIENTCLELSKPDYRNIRCDSVEAIASIDVDAFISGTSKALNFQKTLQKIIAEKKLKPSVVYNAAYIDRKFFYKINKIENYVPKKKNVMALGLALNLNLEEYEAFLASAGYTFMPSSRFDTIIKYCVINKKYNLIEVDCILDSYGEECFSSNEE